MTATDKNCPGQVFRLCLTAVFCVLLACGCGGRGKELLQSGIEKLREGDFEAAATLLELAAESDPDSASVHCNLGLAYWKLRQPDRAMREFKIADRLAKGDERPLEFLGQIHIAGRNIDEARRTFELAAQRAPLSARILTSQAVVANHAGDAEQAKAFLESALELNPGYLPAIFNMGLLYRGPLDNREIAARYFAKYLRMAPDGPHKDKARKLAGLPVTARDMVSVPVGPQPGTIPATRPQETPPRKEVPSKPSKPMRTPPAADPAAATLAKARKAIKEMEFDTALILLNRCVKQHPASADAQWLLAELYDKHLAYHEKAGSAYREFRNRFPNDPRTGSIPQPKPPPASKPAKPQAKPPAKPHAEPTTEQPAKPPAKPVKPARDPEAARRELRRGVRFYQAREWQNAIAAYEEALRLDDRTTDALYNLGLAYKAAGRPEEARKVLEKAVGQNPDMLTARYMLAVVCRDGEDDAAAMEQLDVVLENDPHYSKAHLLLGLIYRARGTNDKARRHIQRYINMEPESRSTEELRNWLDSLNE